MLLQVGICDDEKEDIRILNDYMKHYEMNYDIEFDITCFSSGNDLLQTINKTPCFQILFLDVEMPGLSGIETAARVREIDKPLSTIYAGQLQCTGILVFTKAIDLSGHCHDPK